MLENLFIRTQRSIAGIKIDGVLSETHSNTVRITKNPVELGADITDHAIIEPRKFKLRGIVSDTPIGFAALSNLVDSATSLFGTSTPAGGTRSQQAYSLLKALMDQREPIEVQSKLVLYQNMIITKFDTMQDKDSSMVVDFNMEFEEIILTSTETVDLPSSQLEEGATSQQASSPVERGRVDPEPVAPVREASILKSVSDWVTQ